MSPRAHPSIEEPWMDEFCRSAMVRIWWMVLEEMARKWFADNPRILCDVTKLSDHLQNTWNSPTDLTNSKKRLTKAAHFKTRLDSQTGKANWHNHNHWSHRKCQSIIGCSKTIWMPDIKSSLGYTQLTSTAVNWNNIRNIQSLESNWYCNIAIWCYMHISTYTCACICLINMHIVFCHVSCWPPRPRHCHILGTSAARRRGW